jgi:hypothetical protein
LAALKRPRKKRAFKETTGAELMRLLAIWFSNPGLEPAPEQLAEEFASRFPLLDQLERQRRAKGIVEAGNVKANSDFTASALTQL